MRISITGISKQLPSNESMAFNRYLALYFLLALAIAPVHLLSFDTYYYWDWSRHLDLSYYDGSPMIAYFIKLSTLMFGDTLFALSLVGIITLAISSLFIFKTARLLIGKEASYIAVLLWLFSPLVTLDLLNQTTYDSPLTLFWAMTVYFICEYMQTKKTALLYVVGCCTGLMLLSKYTGIVLVIGSAFFLLISPYRSLYRSIHFYAAIFIACALFSPVIYWNYIHDWQSFSYQLKTHQLLQNKSSLLNVITSALLVFLPILNFMLMPLWFYSRIDQHKKSQGLKFCFIVSISVLVFFLLQAKDTAIRYFWLTPYLITSSIIAGFCYQELRIKKLSHVLIIGYATTSIGILLANTVYFDLFHGKKLAQYKALNSLDKQLGHLPPIVITPGWFEARMLFFLKNKPEIYAIDCGSDRNQYSLWGETFRKSLLEGHVQEALYFDTYDRTACLNKLFKQCLPIPINGPLHAYQCSNG